MANKRDKILVNRSIEIIKERGTISSWDLSNELENMPMSTFNNVMRPILRMNPCIKQDKDKNWCYRYELLPENQIPEINPQMSIVDWIKNSN